MGLIERFFQVGYFGLEEDFFPSDPFFNREIGHVMGDLRLGVATVVKQKSEDGLAESDFLFSVNQILVGQL